MDANALVASLTGFIDAHPLLTHGAAMGAGMALAHIDKCVKFAFDAAMKFPPARNWIRRNPEKAKAIIAQIQKQLNEEIDEEVADEKKSAAVAPAPSPQPPTVGTPPKA